MAKKTSVSCGKELNISHASELKTRLQQAFDKNPTTITLKADMVTKADSAGLQLLLVAQKYCQSQQIDFVIAKASEPMKEIASILGLNEKLQIDV